MAQALDAAEVETLPRIPSRPELHEQTFGGRQSTAVKRIEE